MSWKEISERHTSVPSKARQRASDGGVTLLELTFAIAVFAVALGATAQALISYYSLLDLQNRRTIALEHCRTVAGAIREMRDHGGADYISSIVAWIGEEEEGQGETVTGYADIITGMPGETVTTACTNLWSGGAPADPIEVTVISTFKDLRGRVMKVRLTTVLTRS